MMSEVREVPLEGSTPDTDLDHQEWFQEWSKVFFKRFMVLPKHVYDAKHHVDKEGFICWFSCMNIELTQPIAKKSCGT